MSDYIKKSKVMSMLTQVDLRYGDIADAKALLKILDCATFVQNSNIYISVTGRGKRSRNKNRYVTETRKTWKLLNDFHNKNQRQVFN